jgi:hypothetical protein
MLTAFSLTLNRDLKQAEVVGFQFNMIFEKLAPVQVSEPIKSIMTISM